MNHYFAAVVAAAVIGSVVSYPHELLVHLPSKPDKFWQWPGPFQYRTILWRILAFVAKSVLDAIGFQNRSCVQMKPFCLDPLGGSLVDIVSQWHEIACYQDDGW